jgi:uncharacterized protein YuzE
MHQIKDSFPRIERAKDEVEVLICPHEGQPKRLNMTFVLDLNQFDEIIGLEILNLRLTAGENALGRIQTLIPSSGKSIKYSYDPASDAFYLQISNDRSFTQESTEGTLLVNSVGEIVGFQAKRSG